MAPLKPVFGVILLLLWEQSQPAVTAERPDRVSLRSSLQPAIARTNSVEKLKVRAPSLAPPPRSSSSPSAARGRALLPRPERQWQRCALGLARSLAPSLQPPTSGSLSWRKRWSCSKLCCFFLTSETTATTCAHPCAGSGSDNRPPVILPHFKFLHPRISQVRKWPARQRWRRRRSPR